MGTQGDKVTGLQDNGHWRRVKKTLFCTVLQTVTHCIGNISIQWDFLYMKSVLHSAVATRRKRTESKGRESFSCTMHGQGPDTSPSPDPGSLGTGDGPGTNGGQEWPVPEHQKTLKKSIFGDAMRDRIHFQRGKLHEMTLLVCQNCKRKNMKDGKHEREEKTCLVEKSVSGTGSLFGASLE